MKEGLPALKDFTSAVVTAARTGDVGPLTRYLESEKAKQLADGAKKVADALGKLPADKLPAGAADAVNQAATQIEAAATKAETDPEGAKVDVDTALVEVAKIVDEAKKQVGC